MDAWISRLDGQPSLWIAAEETGILWYFAWIILAHQELGCAWSYSLNPKPLKPDKALLQHLWWDLVLSILSISPEGANTRHTVACYTSHTHR